MQKKQENNIIADFENINIYLKTGFVGQNIRYYKTLASTNSHLKKLADLPEGTVVVADYQTHGKGRLGNVWHSPAGKNLYLSVLLKPEPTIDKFPQMSLVTAIVLVRSLIKYNPNLTPKVKWPNDIFINNKKISGILSDIVSPKKHHFELVIGVGINVNIDKKDFPEELQKQATSLKIVLGEKQQRDKLLIIFLNELEKGYKQWQETGLKNFFQEWKQYSLLTEKTVTVIMGKEKITGEVKGISNVGALIIKEKNTGKIREIFSGNVHIDKIFND